MSKPPANVTSRRRLALAAAALIVALLVAAPKLAGSLQDYEGKPITDITFEGNRTLPEETLLYYLRLEVGQDLNQSDLNAAIKELWQTGLIEDLSVEARQTDTGVGLDVRIVERPRLLSIEYLGLKRVSRTDIEERMSTERIRAFEGEAVELGELRRLEKVIETLYREKGYRFADATFDLTEEGPGEQRVVFTIDEGNRVRIDDIAFEGNTVYSDWRLRQSMKSTKETNVLWRLTKKDIYNPAKLQEDLEAIKELYKKIGYKNITLGEPVIEVRALKPNAADPDEQKRRMFVTIPVEEGERWKLGEITIEGNETYPDSILLRAFEQKSGDWLRSKKLEESIKAIEDVYQNTGYIRSAVRPELIEQDERIADLVVHVREGDQFRIGRIDFEGNSRTRDKVLRRELRVFEADVMSVQRLQNSLLKIRQLGYFKIDEEDPVQILNVNEEKKTMDLVIKGEEADRTELQFGGGWSEFDGFFGQLSLRTQNFMGRGETLGVQVQTGRVRDYYDLSYFVPWFLDRPQRVGIRLFDRSEDYRLLTSQRLVRESLGATLTYGRSFKLFQALNLSYTNSDFSDSTIITVQVRDENGNPVFDEDGNPVLEELTSDLEFRNSSIRPTYIFNSVDNPFEPTRGKRLTFSVDYAGGFLGGNQDYVRPEAAATYYKPFQVGRFKSVFGVNAQAGYIRPFGDYQLSRLDRFYLGGDNSVRGFSFRSIWVRDDDGNTVRDNLGIPLGGDKYFQMNLEYHILTDSPFRAVLFADAGAVFSEDQNIDPGGLRYSAGLELRVMVPLFGAPLRFIYSQNLDPLPEDRFDSFDFTIGASF